MVKKLNPILNRKEFSLEPIFFNGEIVIIDNEHVITEIATTRLNELQIIHQLLNSTEILDSENWNNDISLILIDYKLLDQEVLSIFKEYKKNNPFLRIIGLQNTISNGMEDLSKSKYLKELIQAPTNIEEFSDMISSYSSPFNLKQLKTLIDNPLELSLIIQQFKSETQIDIDQLKIYLRNNQTEQILQIIHRLAGRISQFGGLQFSTALNAIESKERKTQVISEKSKKQIIKTIESIQVSFHTI